MRAMHHVGIGLVGVVLVACAGSGTSGTIGTSTSGAGSVAPTPSKTHTHSSSPVPPESPVPAESNPPGDIPDSTVFVPFRDRSAGIRVTVPEGWSRTQKGSTVSFTDKLNTIALSSASAATAPTVASANATEVPELRGSTLAFRLKNVSSVSLPGGQAILIEYQINSSPNPVTGKQYRLDVERFELFKSGTEGIVTLSSPVGADNVDPWRTVSESFTWI